VILAVLLVPYGLFIESATKSLDSNIDLWWGLVMLLFGILLLALAKSADRSDARSNEES
jgi:steroid 5-alpha reductase family enzyme